MTKRLLCILAGATLLCGSAFAAPVALNNSQLDQVTAGSVFDYVFGDPGAVNQASDNGSTLAAEATFAAADNNSNAVTGTDNEVTSAVAYDDAIANNGDDNTFNEAYADNGANAVSGDFNDAIAVNLVDNELYVDASLKVADENSALATDEGVVYQNQADDESAVATDSATATVKEFLAIDNEDANVVVGEGNTQTIDYMEIEDAEIEEGGMGQIAKYADAENSFNVEEVEIDVDVDIEDSFNVTTNTLDVSGQEGLTAIVNANALDDQNIGVNLSITTATSSVPLGGADGTEGAVESISGNAVAVSLLSQTALNNVVILGGIGITGF